MPTNTNQLNSLRFEAAEFASKVLFDSDLDASKKGNLDGSMCENLIIFNDKMQVT